MARSEFWKHVMTVLAGATGAQILPLLAAPLITRLCAPADMGAFSVWLGVVMVASIGATLRVDAAMILDHEREQQRLCFGVVAYAATVLALALVLFGLAAHVLGIAPVAGMSWFALLGIGAGTWLTAAMQTTLAYAASHRLFDRAAKAKMLQTAVIVLSQVALLYAGLNGGALMAGQLIGLGAGLWAAHRLLAPPTARVKLRLDAPQRAYLVKHQAFWRFSLPSSLLNNVAGQMPLFLIGLHHGAWAAGLYALTVRVLSAPVSLVAASILEVFKRQAVHEFEASGHCRDLYRVTFRTLLVLALGPSLVLLLFAPGLFSWIFGPAWRPAGELARLLAPLCFFNFIAGPFGYLFSIAGRQKLELFWQVAQFLMTIAVFSSPLPLRQSMIAYAIGGCSLCIVHLYLSYQCAQGSAPRRACGIPDHLL
jgi:O-antigen/teichoic acid export membrane protein